MISSATLVISALVVLPSCTVVSVEVEASEVCLTYADIHVEIGDAATSIQQSFVFDDLQPVHDLLKLDAHLEFIRAEVRVTSGLDSLAFLTAAQLVIESGDTGSVLPPLTVYSCDGGCAPAGMVLDVPAVARASATDYVKSDSLLVNVDLQGHPPAASATMDVDVCINTRIDYSYAP